MKVKKDRNRDMEKQRKRIKEKKLNTERDVELEWKDKE